MRAPRMLQETQIKKWNRFWKIKLIVEENPEWRDLAIDLGLCRYGG